LSKTKVNIGGGDNCHEIISLISCTSFTFACIRAGTSF
jgi:hypothetical protein